MSDIKSKKGLEMVLSRVKDFVKPKVRNEQYKTTADIAALAIWTAYMKGDIKKVSVDLGCGTGILGIGLLLMGSKKVYFIDNDQEALDICLTNIKFIKSEGLFDGDYEVICCNIEEFNEKVDLVFENPPFGTKIRHADRVFLLKSFELGNTIYSFHKSETLRFVTAICGDNGFILDETIKIRMPLRAQFGFHMRKNYRINVNLCRIIRKYR